MACLIEGTYRGLGARQFFVGALFAAITCIATAPSIAQKDAAKTTPADTEPEAEIPKLPFDAQKYRPTAEENHRIDELIARLRETDTFDFGFAPLASGSQFSPWDEAVNFRGGMFVPQYLKSSDAAKTLVALGPKSLPRLLEKLTDATPTKLAIQGGDAQWYAREIAMNQANPKEREVRQKFAELWKPAKGGLFGEGEIVARHKISTGDICFALVGQIVNRGYEAARYQPSNCRVINSPSHDPKIAEVVRAIWNSDDPAKMLFESLLVDLHTRQRADLQGSAAMRLLFYFPSESAELIVSRIKAINPKAGRDGDISFVSAVRSTAHPGVLDALLDVMKQAESPKLVEATLSASVVKRAPDKVLRRLREIIVDKPSENGADRFLNLAVKFFPGESRELFEKFGGTTETKVSALNQPLETQAWMVDYLKKLLDDRNLTESEWDVYGFEWDLHRVRVCDEAAKVLAKFHMKPPVRFEYEENPEFLDRQIAKLRRVLAGERNVSLEFPPELSIPKDLPARGAKRIAVLPGDYGFIHSISNDKTIWIGDGFQGRGGWAYDTVRIDTESGKITERIPLDQWKGGVSLLENGQSGRAYCYHGDEGGHVFVRDLATGRELKKIPTPFHDGVEFNDPLQIRDLGDIVVSGKEGEWLLAVTPDLALHSIHVESGKHRLEWKYKPAEGEKPFGHGQVIGVRGGSKVLLEEIGGDSLFDAPILIWDQSKQAMTKAERLPKSGWQGGSGDLAWNGNYGGNLWNIAKLQNIKLPRSEQAIASFAADRPAQTVFALRTSGAVDVFRVSEGIEAKPVAQLSSPLKGSLSQAIILMSSDDRYLLWQGSPRVLNKEGDSMASDKTIIGIFDVSDLTSPSGKDQSKE